MTDSYADHAIRRTLLAAFPAPLEWEQGDWERVLALSSTGAHRRGRFLSGPKVRLAVACAAGAILLMVAGVAVAARAGLIHMRIFGINIAVTPEKAQALQRLESVATTDANTTPVPEPPFTPDPIPAQMLPADTPVPASESITHVTNDWLVSDGYTLVAVYAGAAGMDATKGRVVILRQDLVKGTQSFTTADAGKTGALTITSAPQGASVEKSAQTGDIELQGADGGAFTLHLATDTISSG